MGKTRGHGTRKGGASSGRSRGGRGFRPATEAAASDYDEDSEEEKTTKVRVKRDGELKHGVAFTNLLRIALQCLWRWQEPLSHDCTVMVWGAVLVLPVHS